MTDLLAPLRYNRDVDDVARAVRRLMDGMRSGAFTEAPRFRSVLAPDGYVLVHPRGRNGEAECALVIHRDDFVRDLGAIQLSDVPIPRRNGWYNFAVAAETVDGIELMLHMPSGVEGPDGFRDDHPGQVKAYRAQIAALRQWVAEHPKVRRIRADWNLDARLEWVRAYFARHFPDFEIVAPTTGTHGRRVIDWALVRKGHGDWSAETVDNPASDHEAVIATLQEATMNDPRIVTRDQWGARPRGATRSTHPIGRTVGITAHWGGPRMGAFPHSECAGKVRSIERFHRDTRGWADIAYNALVCPHGYVFEGRGPGVKSAANGGTTSNDTHYAVCYLGGEGDGFTTWGMSGFLRAFGWLRDEGDAGPERNGHRDHKATQCPGDEIYRWVHRLPAGAGTSDRPAHTPTEEIDMTPDELRQIIREEISGAFRNDGKRRVLDLGEARIEHPDDTETAKTLGRLLYTIRDNTAPKE